MELFKLSISEIKMAKECEIKLYYSLVKPKPALKPIYFLIGSVFHDIVARNLKHKFKHGQDMQLDRLNATFTEVFDKEVKKGYDFSKMSPLEAQGRARNYVKLYWEGQMQYLFPAEYKGQPFVEEYMSFNINQEGEHLRITFKLDMLDRSGWIMDHKTGKPWNTEKEPAAYLYPIGLLPMGIKSPGVRFNYVSDYKVEVIEIPFDRQKADSLLNYCFSIQKAFRDENLFATNNEKICGRCNYRLSCKHYNSI